MSSSPKVTYVDKSDAAIERLKDLLKPRLEAAALVVRDEIVTTINDSDPTGRTYRIPGTGATYRASAPGEPPAIREGLYVSSWHGTPAVELGNAVMAAAFTNRRVGAHSLGELLEYGTKRGLAPRPHVRPAMTKAKPKVKRILRTG